MKMEQTECSETSAYKIQTPGNYPEENIQQMMICLNVLFCLCQFYALLKAHIPRESAENWS